MVNNIIVWIQRVMIITTILIFPIFSAWVCPTKAEMEFIGNFPSGGVWIYHNPFTDDWSEFNCLKAYRNKLYMSIYVTGGAKFLSFDGKYLVEEWGEDEGIGNAWSADITPLSKDLIFSCWARSLVRFNGSNWLKVSLDYLGTEVDYDYNPIVVHQEEIWLARHQDAQGAKVGKVFRSNDDGRTFEPVLETNTRGNPSIITYWAGVNGIAITSWVDELPAPLFYSTDNGMSFSSKILQAKNSVGCCFDGYVLTFAHERCYAGLPHQIMYPFYIPFISPAHQSLRFTKVLGKGIIIPAADMETGGYLLWFEPWTGELVSLYHSPIHQIACAEVFQGDLYIALHSRNEYYRRENILVKIPQQEINRLKNPLQWVYRLHHYRLLDENSEENMIALPCGSASKVSVYFKSDVVGVLHIDSIDDIILGWDKVAQIDRVQVKANTGYKKVYELADSYIRLHFVASSYPATMDLSVKFFP